MEILVLSQNDCNPCKMVKNFLNDNEVSYKETNVSDHPEFVDVYSIMSAPVTLLLDEGEEVVRVVGYKPAELMTLIEQL